MKMKAFFMITVLILVLILFTGCELELIDGSSIYYTGMGSGIRRLRVINNLGETSIYSIFAQNSGTGVRITDDLLGIFTLPGGNTNTIVGLPSAIVHLELIFTDDGSWNALYQNVNFTASNVELTVEVGTGSSEWTNYAAPQSGTQIIVQGNIVLKIREIP